MTPGTGWPRVTVPNPPIGSFFALSVLVHPLPKPANNASVAAVRFIFPPKVGPNDGFCDPLASNTISTIPRRNFAQSWNNRHSRRKMNSRFKAPMMGLRNEASIPNEHV
jgi:hypothetical protein